jgi:hypothetical protein
MKETSALRLPSPVFESVDRPDLAVAVSSALRLAPPPSIGVTTCESPTVRAVVLRNADLVADLHHARAARFASRYEWLALRRRRAQIAARHELEG